MIAKLQYISIGDTPQEHLDNIEDVCQAGCDWVQLRLKDYNGDTVLASARKAKAICDNHNTKLMINDNPLVAKKTNADGVHLGKNDMSPSEARTLLGKEFIIGGTANNFEDIKRLVNEGVDYIGLGPFRFTATKKNLSSVLGLEGYREIMKQCITIGIDIPVVAIGGIRKEDISELLDSGVYGVAMASGITEMDDKMKFFTEIDEVLPIR